MRLYERKLLNAFNHPAWFCGHRYCGSEEIMVLVCCVILQDQVSNGGVTLWVEASLDKPTVCQV